MNTTTCVGSAGVADVHRDPDPDSELVTQALMNVEAMAGETDGEWTHVTLSDYTGWMRSNQLEEPVVKGFCKIRGLNRLCYPLCSQRSMLSRYTLFGDL